MVDKHSIGFHYICPTVKKAPASIVILFFCHTILAIFLFSARLGTVDISWSSFFSALLHKNPENIASTLLWDIRIPRFFMAVLAGGNLALAGQSMQILVRNPLADPYTMGTAGGAALGINLALLGWVPAFLQTEWLLPFWGFGGAMAAMLLIFLLASGKKKMDNVLLILVGIAVSILAGSLISLVTYMASRQSEVRHILFWAFGNLDKSNMTAIRWVLLVSLVLLIILQRGKLAWAMLSLGDEKSESLGFKTGRLKRILLIISALLTTTVVCTVGPIGFVGLIVPFWIRKFYTIQHTLFWPVTFMAGGSFLSLCDLLSRLAFQPSGLPIGLVTSLSGLPFFVYLLRENARKVGL